MRVKQKEPLRPPKKIEKNRKRRKVKIKREKGHTTIPFERSTLVLHPLSLVLHRDHHTWI